MSKWGTACCPRDGEPLIATFEVRKKEFLCMVCGDYLEFLSPVGKPDDTPGLQERYAALKARFDAGERPASKGSEPPRPPVT